MTFKTSVDRAALAIENLDFADGTLSLGIDGRRLIAETVLYPAGEAYQPPEPRKFGYSGWTASMYARGATTENALYLCYETNGKVKVSVRPRAGEAYELEFEGSTLDDAVRAAEREDAMITAAREALKAKPPALVYRPNGDTDDWGMIRRSNGNLFAVVRRPLAEVEANEARRAKTDPFEALSRLLISATEGIVSHPDDSRRALVELCASIAAGEKTRSDAVSQDIDATDWDKVAARHHAEAAERIRLGILGVLETFKSPDDEASSSGTFPSSVKKTTETAKPRVSVLDMSRFPQRTDDFRSMLRVPVLFSPIMGSPERFVIGCVCSDDDGIHLERANKLDRLVRLFGELSQGAIEAIEIVLDALSSAIHTDEFLFDSYRSPVSGFAFGERETTEGRSLQEAGSLWMSAMSSLYTQAPATTAAEQS